ncbi:MAG: hypothetical protein K1X57_20940 [Gemmataceae bacterium]|nr:hypothetical protein [Gemmataceae bacterium]
MNFSEPVTGVDVSDFSIAAVGLSNPFVAAVSGTGAERLISVNTGSGSGTLLLNLIDDDSIQSSSGDKLGGPGAGNGSYTSGPSFSIDRAPPGVFLNSTSSEFVTGAFSVTVTFTEPVTGFSPSSVAVTNGSIANIAGAATTYTLSILPASAGEVTVAVPASVVQDAVGNPNTASNALTRSMIAAEFQISQFNGAVLSNTHGRAAALEAAGGAFVVWEQVSNQNTRDIYGRRINPYSTSGSPTFLVNSTTDGNQRFPAVAIDSDGEAIVVWDSNQAGENGYGVFGQRYTATGNKLGTSFRINTFSTATQRAPSVAVDATGNTLIVWQSWGQDGNSYGVYGQRYNPTGQPIGGEFRVNSTTSHSEFSPVVAMDADGDAIVVWVSDAQDGSNYGIFAQRFNAAGSKVGGEFQVNTFSTGIQSHPSVAVNAAGDAVIAWASKDQLSIGYGIYARRYSASGIAVTGEFPVSSFASRDRNYPAAAISSSGDSVVTWQSYGEDGDGSGIFGRRFNFIGTPVDLEFRINSTTVGNQSIPSIATNTQGDLFACWMNSPTVAPNASLQGRWIAGQDIDPPTVTTIIVNDGSPQRSRVTSLTVTFSEPVNLTPSTFQLSRTGPGGPTGNVTLAVSTSASTSTQTVAKLTFSGSLTEFASLVDGRYVLTVNGAQYSDLGGLAGSTTSLEFHRLFGDTDGNRIVNAVDLLAFRLAFLSNSPTFDFDGNGQVDFRELLPFRLRFLQTI